MSQRKSEKSNLEKTRLVFWVVGFMLIAGTVFGAFKFKTYDKVAYDFLIEVDEDYIEIPEIVQPEEQVVIQQKKPKPKAQEPELEIVPDEEEVPEETFDDEDEEDLEIDETDETSEDAEELVQQPLMFVKNMPYYPECAGLKGHVRNKCMSNAIMQKVRDAFIYPEIAKEMGWEGTARIRFVIGADGKVGNIEVIQGINEVLDKAAIEAVSKLPRSNPGKQLDKPVPIIYTIPLKIKLR